MRPGWIISPIVHLGLLAAFGVAFHAQLPDADGETLIPVEFLDVGDVTDLAPIAPLEDDAMDVSDLGAPQDAAPPPPELALEKLPDKPPPAPSKKKGAESLDDFEALLDIAKKEKSKGQEASNQNAQKGEKARAGRGEGVTVSEMAAIQAQFEECWTAPVGVAMPERLVVQVAVRFEADGHVINAQVVSPKSWLGQDASTRAAVETALRAVSQCDPLRVSKTRTKPGSNIFVFDPRKMNGL